MAQWRGIWRNGSPIEMPFAIRRRRLAEWRTDRLGLTESGRQVNRVDGPKRVPPRPPPRFPQEVGFGQRRLPPVLTQLFQPLCALRITGSYGRHGRYRRLASGAGAETIESWLQACVVPPLDGP